MRKTLLTAILSIAMCMCLLTGATFALFTSTSEVDISVTSGTVDIQASVSDVKIKELTEDTYTTTVADGETAYFNANDARTLTFDKKTLTLTNIVCGDSVQFKVNVVNNSTVTTKYRVVISSSGELFSGLQVSANNETFLGKTYTAWKTLAVGSNGDSIPFEITLPDTGNSDHDNKFQGKVCDIVVSVEGIQGNAETFNDTTAGAVVGTQENATTGKTETTQSTTVSSNGFKATIPAGTTLNANATTATLNVTKEAASTGNFDVAAMGAEAIGLNISIPEVAADNETPITVTLENILGTHLNGVMLYHKGAPMTSVDSVAEVGADGEFFYDANTGSVTLATKNFSNFTLVKLNSTPVSTETELTKAINNGQNVIFASNITLSKTLPIKKNVVIDLNGYTLNTSANATLMQSYSGPKPTVLINSTKSGATINAGANTVILGYGSTTFNNVEINVGTVKSSSLTPFNVYGDLTLGKGTVVNVEYLGTSLISNSGAIAIAIDGAVVNVGTFKVNGGYMISTNAKTTLAINNATFNVKLDTTYTSYFCKFAENVTMNGCTFNVTDEYGVKNEVAANEEGTYVWSYKVAVSNETELTKAIGKGQNVRFTSNITLSKTLPIQKNVIIDLNGYTLDTSANAKLMQSYSGPKPTVVVISYKAGAKINAGANTVILGYGSTAFYNVEINVGTVKSSSYVPFNVYGDLTLGKGTVVNVEYLGTSLISNSGAIAIAIDGAVVNVDTFKVNGSALISRNQSTTIALNNATFNVVLDRTYSSLFINNAVTPVDLSGATFNVTDLDGAKYNVTETYGWVKA